MSDYVEPRLLRLYRSMTSDQLLDLQAAFTADRVAARTAETREFCEARLVVIDAVLRERGEYDAPPTTPV